MPNRAAMRLIDKLRAFAGTLDADEREALAWLLAPGVAQAYEPEPEVTGFDVVAWSPARLAESIAEAVRASGLVVGAFDIEERPPID